MLKYDPAWVSVHLSEGRRGIMKFTLVWQGELPASANKGKPLDVERIRNELSPQLAYLWQTHNALKVLKDYGFRKNPASMSTIVDQNSTPRQIYKNYPGHLIDMCEWITIDQRRYMPLVRKSLSLSCELSILFLRQDDPGSLITQGGDLDGRLKTLLDALRMPSDQELARVPKDVSDVYCLMESDTLVSALDIDTDRLLFPQSARANEAHLIIEVTLNVLQVHEGNICLL